MFKRYTPLYVNNEFIRKNIAESIRKNFVRIEIWTLGFLSSLLLVFKRAMISTLVASHAIQKNRSRVNMFNNTRKKRKKYIPNHFFKIIFFFKYIIA